MHIAGLLIVQWVQVESLVPVGPCLSAGFLSCKLLAAGMVMSPFQYK